MRVDDANRCLLRGDDSVLASLPEGVDVKLAMARLRRHWPALNVPNRAMFAPFFRALPPSLIEACLAELSRQKNGPNCVRFVRAIAKSPGSWRNALDALALLDNLANERFGVARHRAQIAKVAAMPDCVDGIQGLVVSEPTVPEDWRAVLVADGSDESADALLPSIERSFTQGGAALDELARLERFATAPTMKALFAANRRRIHARRTASPAHDLAKHIGLSPRKSVRFQVGWGLVEQNEFLFHDCTELMLTVDSRSADWCVLEIFARNGTYRPGEDVLGLGRFDPYEMGALLPRIAKKLRRQLVLSGMTQPRSERGIPEPDQERVLEWLLPDRPALALARSIGLGSPESARFRVNLVSVEKRDGRPAMEVTVTVDSLRGDWYDVTLQHGGRVTFFNNLSGCQDNHGLGRCNADEIPSYVARAAKKLGAHLRIATMIRSVKHDRPLAPADRKHLLTWLQPALGSRR
jgi:hypothetical protein